MRTQSFPTLFLFLVIASFLITGTVLYGQESELSSREPSDQSPISTLLVNSTAPVSSSTRLTNEAAISNARSTVAASTTGQIESRLEALRKVLDQDRQSGDRRSEAETQCAIARSYDALRQRQRAIEHFQSALAIWRELGNKGGEATTFAYIGNVYREWGFPQQATRFYRDALAIYPLTTDKEGQAAALNNLGLAYFALRDRKKCLHDLDQAIASFRALQNRQGEALTLINFGATYGFLMNDPRKAIDLLQEAVTKLEMLDDSDSLANALDLMGVIWLKIGKPDMSALTFRRALTLYRGIRDAQGEASVLRHMKVLGVPGEMASSR